MKELRLLGEPKLMFTSQRFTCSTATQPNTSLNRFPFSSKNFPLHYHGFDAHQPKKPQTASTGRWTAHNSAQHLSYFRTIALLRNSIVSAHESSRRQAIAPPHLPKSASIDGLPNEIFEGKTDRILKRGSRRLPVTCKAFLSQVPHKNHSEEMA